MTHKNPTITKNISSAPRYYSFRYVPLWFAAITLLSIVFHLTVGAVTTISQSYSTTDKLSLGSIVSLEKNSTDQVIASASSNVDSLLGVVISAENSLLSLSSGQPGQVQIATTGTIQVLVSDINGTIVRGDHITASPLSGVGMKATSNARVVGVAQGDLPTNSAQQSYASSDGAKHSVALGEVPILVNVSSYFREPDKTIVPSALQNLANALAGKTVSTLPILISAAIFIIMLIVVVSIIYAMIRSSIISVGRNPMAQSAVYRDLIQLSALVLGILAVGLIAIYLILTRM